MAASAENEMHLRIWNRTKEQEEKNEVDNRFFGTPKHWRLKLTKWENFLHFIFRLLRSVHVWCFSISFLQFICASSRFCLCVVAETIFFLFLVQFPCMPPYNNDARAMHWNCRKWSNSHKSYKYETFQLRWFEAAVCCSAYFKFEIGWLVFEPRLLGADVPPTHCVQNFFLQTQAIFPTTNEWIEKKNNNRKW